MPARPISPTGKEHNGHHGMPQQMKGREMLRRRVPARLQSSRGGRNLINLIDLISQSTQPMSSAHQPYSAAAPA